MPHLFDHGSVNEGNEIGRVPRFCPGRAPRPKRGGFDSSLARDMKGDEIGGLCGLCSRGLPLDWRLLFVAELTDHRKWVMKKLVRRPGTAPGRSETLVLRTSAHL